MTLEQLVTLLSGYSYMVDEGPIHRVTKKTIRYMRISLFESYDVLEYTDGRSEYWTTKYDVVDIVDVWYHAKTHEVINWAHVEK